MDEQLWENGEINNLGWSWLVGGNGERGVVSSYGAYLRWSNGRDERIQSSSRGNAANAYRCCSGNISKEVNKKQEKHGIVKSQYFCKGWTW